MKTYSFKVVVEQDEDFDGNPSGWHAYCPALERQGASTWGETESEALKRINEVVRMVVESMLEHIIEQACWTEEDLKRLRLIR